MTETAASGEFDGCGRTCRRRGEHTLTWGECEHGKRPEPRLAFFRTGVREFGEVYGYEVGFPVRALAPWAGRLSVDEQHRMMEEAADSEDPAGVIERWRLVADAREVAGRAAQFCPGCRVACVPAGPCACCAGSAGLPGEMTYVHWAMADEQRR